MKKVLFIYFLISVFLFSKVGLYAVVTADITLPTNTLVNPVGDTFVITNGTVMGNNLFHSFSEFSITSAQTAGFGIPAGINNVFSRVTGNNISNIEGSIVFNNPAIFFFINPNGIIFGPDASLDIASSVFFGTCDFISYADGGRFDATTPGNDVLSTANLSEFGFIDNDIGGILINGSDFSGDFTSDMNIALAGGDIDIVAGSKIHAQGGRIDIVSVKSPGLIKPPVVPNEPILEGFSTYGKISIVNGTSLNVSSNGNSGDIYIRAGEFILDRSGIRSDTVDGQGGELKIQCNDFEIKNGAVISVNTEGTGQGGNLNILAENSALITGFNGSPTWLQCATSSSGDAGSLNIVSPEIVISDRGNITGSVFGASGSGADVNLVALEQVKITGKGNINTITTGIGKGGFINITTPDLEISYDGALVANNTDIGEGGGINLNVSRLVLDKGLIGATSYGPGNGGEIAITASESVILNGVNTFNSGSNDGQLIRTASKNSGNGGLLYIKTSDFKINNGAQVTAAARGSGNGGSISIDADNLYIFDKSIISAASFASGDGGYIGLKLNTCRINEGSQINSSAFSTGKSGTIEIKADQWVDIQGNSTGEDTGLISKSGSLSSGDAGYIRVETKILTMSENAKINTSSEGTGNAGNIDLITEKIDLESGVKISSVSSGIGNAGGIIVKASDRISLNDSTISVQSEAADGGDIDIYTIYWLMLKDSTISAEVKGGTGNGGNIYIDPIYVILENSKIIANAFGGIGGNIYINTNVYLKDIPSIVSASSRLGIDGHVEIQAPDIDVSSSLQTLPVNFEEVEKMLPKRCSSRARGDSGSFQITGKFSLPLDPDKIFYIP